VLGVGFRGAGCRVEGLPYESRALAGFDRVEPCHEGSAGKGSAGKGSAGKGSAGKLHVEPCATHGVRVQETIPAVGDDHSYGGRYQL